MSVLIKDMEMPTGCCALTVKVWADGQVEIINADGEWKTSEAVSVPPHGDLIDRDRASERFAELAENIEAKLGYECSASYTLASLFLQNKEEFPTIIEKEDNR